MQDLNDKVITNTLTAVEWNEVPSEIQNIIEATLYNQSLSSGDLNQLGKGVAGYAASGTFYTGSGTANAHIATKLTGMQAPPNYGDGMIVRFRPSNANTAGATINVDSLGVKTIKKEDGTVLSAGDLDTAKDAWLRYDGTDFLLSNWASTSGNPTEFVGFWERTSGATYTLKPGIGGEIIINIDGVRLVRTTDLTFDFGDIDTGGEVASTAYYFYIDNLAGVMDAVVSVSPPVDLGAGKAGYHPTRTDERCVLGVWNDAGSDFPEASHMRDGMVIFQNHDGDHEHNLLEAADTSWRSVTPLVPATALSVVFSDTAVMSSGDGIVVWGVEGATGGLGAGDDDPRAIADAMYFASASGSSLHSISIHGELPILTRTAPVIAYGVTNNLDGTSHNMIINGYLDWCAPTW